MTYEQAEAIKMLRYSPEMKALCEVQQEALIAEMEVQCAKGKDASHNDFLFQAGKLEGLRRLQFGTILEQAKKIIEEAKKKDDTVIVNH